MRQKKSPGGNQGSKQKSDSTLLYRPAEGEARKYVHGDASRNARRQAMFDTDGDLRRKPSAIFHDVKPTDRFRAYVESEYLPHVRLGDRLRKQKADAVTGILANLYLIHKAGGKVLAASRNTGQGADPQARARVRLYDELERAGIIRKHLGSEESGKVTRYALGNIEACQARQWDFLDVVDPALDEPTSERYQPSEFAPVILRPSKDETPGHKHAKRGIPFPANLSQKERGLVRDLERLLMAINNRNLLEHTWLYSILDPYGQSVALNQVNPVMRAIFNGDFQHGGRFYSRGVNGYQNLSKPERRTMLIDGERIAERDYSGFHTRLLYHKEGKEFTGDVYQPQEVLRGYRGWQSKKLRKAGRGYVKDLTNIIINARTLRSSIGAAYQAMKETPAYETVLDACGMRPEQVIFRIKRIHKPIAHYFHSGIGLSVQCEDAFLMLYVIQQFHNLRKPALSLHDAILCKESDADLAEKSMIEIYELMYGFKPEIKADWPPR